METKQSQIKINLSTSLKNMVKVRANKYGLTLAGFTKYLLFKDLEESDQLDFSDETWKNIKYAKSGKAKWLSAESIKDLDKMVDSVK